MVLRRGEAVAATVVPRAASCTNCVLIVLCWRGVCVCVCRRGLGDNALTSLPVGLFDPLTTVVSLCVVQLTRLAVLSFTKDYIQLAPCSWLGGVLSGIENNPFKFLRVGTFDKMTSAKLLFVFAMSAAACMLLHSAAFADGEPHAPQDHDEHHTHTSPSQRCPQESLTRWAALAICKWCDCDLCLDACLTDLDGNWLPCVSCVVKWTRRLGAPRLPFSNLLSP